MIIRGTTPTITFTFTDIDVNELDVCYLTIKTSTPALLPETQSILIEKTLAEAEVGENSLSWHLTQEETLKIDPAMNLEIQIRYRIGTQAYASRIFSETAYRILKGGEI